MIFDSHVHTEISADSEMEAAAALQRAAELGLGLVFTEHEDLDYPGELDFTFSPEDYWRKYEALRGSNLRLGAEIGLQTGLADRNRAFLAKVPFDLVIGSIHLLDAKAGDVSPRANLLMFDDDGGNDAVERGIRKAGRVAAAVDLAEQRLPALALRFFPPLGARFVRRIGGHIDIDAGHHQII